MHPPEDLGTQHIGLYTFIDTHTSLCSHAQMQADRHMFTDAYTQSMLTDIDTHR